MADRPILMSAPMVRAILAGAKTQTRRLVKGAPDDWAPMQPEVYSPTVVDRHGDEQPGPDAFGAGNEDGSDWVPCPYGQPGDRLWVREAWGYRCSAGTSAVGQYMHTIAYRADDARHSYGPMPIEGVGLPKWRERDDGMSPQAWDDRMTAYWRQWRPSIHMPRWASRITLEITAVRVERLRDISEADAKAEGISEFVGGWWCEHDDAEQIAGMTPQEGYAHLWERINGAGSWAENPWVWVVTFQRAGQAPNRGVQRRAR